MQKSFTPSVALQNDENEFSFYMEGTTLFAQKNEITKYCCNLLVLLENPNIIKGKKYFKKMDPQNIIDLIILPTFKLSSPGEDSDSDDNDNNDDNLEYFINNETKKSINIDIHTIYYGKKIILKLLLNRSLITKDAQINHLNNEIYELKQLFKSVSKELCYLKQNMVNYWYIKVAGNGKYFNEILQKSLNDNSIGIGFSIMKDFNFTTQQDRNNIWNNEGDSNKQKEIKENNFDKFIKQMNIGDIVFLCKGVNTILYMAEILSNYYYDDSYTIQFPKYSLPHRRHITNIKSFNTTAPKRMVGTLYKV